MFAHEFGHCFGLEHNSTVDGPNMANSPGFWSYLPDIMAALWQPGRPLRLKPSNQAPRRLSLSRSGHRTGYLGRADVGNISLMGANQGEQMYKRILLAALALMVTGCMTPREVVEQGNLSVSTALHDVGKGFVALEKELQKQTLGLFPCSLTIALNVRSSAENQGQLVVDNKVGARAETGGLSEASTENEVRIGLYNPACVPTGTARYTNPTSLEALKQGMILTDADIKQARNPVN